MRPSTVFLLSLWIPLFLSCSQLGKSAPPRDEVEAKLRQLAEEEKRQGEADVNPALGVKITWTIQGVEVREQPDNEEAPYAGTIRFLIESQTPELDGTVTERFDRSYDYVWDLELEKWVLQ